MRREQFGWRPEINFGERLRITRRKYAERLGHSVTQRNMADAIGVAYGNYAAWEAGNGIPTDLADVVKKVWRVTGVDPFWLLGWSDDSDGPDGDGGIPAEVVDMHPDNGTTREGTRTLPTKWYSPPARAA
jgi:DNA-binding XRE family transcriptional regulator